MLDSIGELPSLLSVSAAKALLEEEAKLATGALESLAPVVPAAVVPGIAAVMDLDGDERPPPAPAAVFQGSVAGLSFAFKPAPPADDAASRSRLASGVSCGPTWVETMTTVGSLELPGDGGDDEVEADDAPQPPPNGEGTLPEAAPGPAWLEAGRRSG